MSHMGTQALKELWGRIVNNFALKSETVKNISRSGTTFTATRANGTTFTFDQQVNSVLAAYPIGSIYMSVDSTSPETLFGGTWERLKDRFLLASDDTTYTPGTTGGSTSVTLSTDNLPAHTYWNNVNSWKS